MLKNVNEKLSKLSKSDKYFQDIYDKQKGYSGKSPTELLNDLRRPLVEQQQALQASLSYSRAITQEMANQERHSKGIYSQIEIDENLAKANDSYKNAIGDKARAEAKKEVDKWQKISDSISIKSLASSSKKGETAAEKLKKQLEKELEDRTKLLDKWAKTDAEYISKGNEKNKQEIDGVKLKYAEIKKEIEKYNKDAKGEKIDLTNFDKSVDSSILLVKQRQANDKKAEQYDKDYKNYLRYEELKKEAGEKYR